MYSSEHKVVAFEVGAKDHHCRVVFYTDGTCFVDNHVKGPGMYNWKVYNSLIIIGDHPAAHHFQKAYIEYTAEKELLG